MNEKARRLMRQVRERCGLKQSDIGKELGVTGATVSAWEVGKAVIGIEEFVRYCQMCGADYAAILTAAYGDPTEPLQTVECTADEAELIRMFRALDASGQRRTMRHLRGEYEDAMASFGEESLSVTSHG